MSKSIRTIQRRFLRRLRRTNRITGGTLTLGKGELSLEDCTLRGADPVLVHLAEPNPLDTFHRILERRLEENVPIVLLRGKI